MKLTLLVLFAHCAVACLSWGAGVFFLDSVNQSGSNWGFASVLLMLLAPACYAVTLVGSWIYPFLVKEFRGRQLVLYIAVNTVLSVLGGLTSGWSFIVIAFHLLPSFS